MFSAQHSKLFVAAWIASSLLLSASLSQSLHAQVKDPRVGHEPVTMVVVVKEADTGDPIPNARITLQFTEPSGPTIPTKGKHYTYNAKTDVQGRCKITGINKGPIVLMVTATSHQAFGKELQLEKEDQVFEIKLKRPQPLI
jgi:2-methylaconitate cis-trans-isomerase PrpF